jgi:hypothetical protein
VVAIVAGCGQRRRSGETDRDCGRGNEFQHVFQPFDPETSPDTRELGLP